MDNQPSILVVEDEPTIRSLLQMALEMHGFRVATAGNGKIALHILEKEEFDVIITDMNMPVMDGSELLQELKSRQDRKYNVLVVSASTGYNREDLIDQGALDVLPKPCDMDTLVRKTNEILHFRNQEKSLGNRGSFSCRLAIPKRDGVINGYIKEICVDGALVEVNEKPDMLTGIALYLSMPYNESFDNVDADLVEQDSQKTGQETWQLIIYFNDHKKEELLKRLGPFLHQNDPTAV